MTENETNSELKKIQKRNNIIVISLAVLLVVVIALFFWQRGQHNNIMGQLNDEKDSIQLQLQGMVMQYDSLETDNDSISYDLELAQTKVKDLLTEVTQVKKASYQEISAYKSKVETMNRIMKDFVKQIDSLHQRNQVLMAENRQVKQDYAKIENVNKQLEKEKERMARTVDKAKTLEAINITGVGLTPRERETDRSIKTQKLKIGFTLAKNPIAERGNKKVYIRIMRPDQLLMINSSKDVFKFENMKIPYSAMREVTYEGKDLAVNIYWDNTGKQPLKAGTYTIDVFADGDNIGTKTFVLKR